MKNIQKHFPDLTPKQLEQFAALGDLYPEWNAKINVISRKDIEQLFTNHVLHSLAIAKLIQFQDGSKVLDIGTGGGFPGIPLAIMFPEVSFTLVDSIGKKIAVVREVVTALGLKNVKAVHGRAETVLGKFDFVTNRAVTRMINMLPWVEGKISPTSNHEIPNGIISLKGGDLDEELAEIKQQSKSWEICDFFDDPYFETKKVVHVKMP